MIKSEIKIEKFRGKNISLDIYIDNTYRPYLDGVPQYRYICKFNGKIVYDDKLGVKEISFSDVLNLKNYALKIGAYNRECNAYGCFDLYCRFMFY